MRWLLPIILLIGWFLFANNWLSKQRTSCCTAASSISTNQAAAATPSGASTTKTITNETGPMLFAWSDCKPKTTTNWNAFRDSVISSLPKNHLLDISVWKYTPEKNLCNNQNLAESRAKQIKAMFSSHISEDKYRITATTRTDKSEAWKSNLFRAASFRYAMDGENVKEINNKALIYFPTNSSRKLTNREIDQYLQKVAKRVKKSGEDVSLVGHTDNAGTSDKNIKLGQRRADHIKQLLVKMGVPSNQINTTSKGETKPIDTNETAQGRQKNRRTELLIN